MLPALTARRGALVTRRVALAAASAALAAAALLTQLAPATAPPAPPASLADELRPSSWALQIPVAWLAAPVPAVHRGDALDLLAVRGGDRAYAVPIAYALTVMSADERAIVVDVDQDDAIAIANARGAGLLLVPLLRSTR